MAGSKKNLKFEYDAFGRRIAKHVYNNETAMLEKSTYYILDAQGNQLSMYEHRIDTNSAKYYLAERNIYGSSRLGTTNDTINMFMPEILPSYGIMGNRTYELSNHLGNILTVINDVKYPISSDNTTIDGYEVGMNGISDYSPFGAPLDGRTVESGKYRYTTQGQGRDDEILKGFVNFTYRGYDPRLGRLNWAVDPLAGKYPYYSPYAFSGNRVIDAVELEGLEPEATNPGIDYLFIVVLGYEGKEPPKGQTQNKNNPHSQSDYDTQIQKNGLTEIESHFQDRSDVKVVVFSSAKLANLTEADVMETMNLYVQNNPNGKIALVGHSLGATNIINAAESSNIPIHFMYTIDIASFKTWDVDDIPSNVEYFVNVYQNTFFGVSGEIAEVIDESKTIGFNHKATDMNLSHTTIDNLYSNKVINRLESISKCFKPLSSTEIDRVNNKREQSKKIRESIQQNQQLGPKY